MVSKKTMGHSLLIPEIFVFFCQLIKKRMLVYMLSPNTNTEPSSRHCLTDINWFYAIQIKILGENRQ